MRPRLGREQRARRRGPTDLPPLDTVLHGIVLGPGRCRDQQEFLARYAFVHTVTRQNTIPSKLKKRKQKPCLTILVQNSPPPSRSSDGSPGQTHRSCGPEPS